MSRKQNIESRTEEHFQILLQGRNPIVSRVLARDSSFRAEVENFYDLSTRLRAIPRAGIVRDFNFQEEDPQKRGKHPTDLIKILSRFGEEPLNINRLQYDSVREDYRRWNAPLRKISRVTVGLSTLLGTVGGIGGVIHHYFEKGDLITAIPFGIVGLASMGTHLWALLHYPGPPKGTNNELEEYVKLHESAEEADSFMEKHYRNYFIKKTLATATG